MPSCFIFKSCPLVLGKHNFSRCLCSDHAFVLFYDLILISQCLYSSRTLTSDLWQMSVIFSDEDHESTAQQSRRQTELLQIYGTVRVKVTRCDIWKPPLFYWTALWWTLAVFFFVLFFLMCCINKVDMTWHCQIRGEWELLNTPQVLFILQSDEAAVHSVLFKLKELNCTSVKLLSGITFDNLQTLLHNVEKSPYHTSNEPHSRKRCMLWIFICDLNIVRCSPDSQWW